MSNIQHDPSTEESTAREASIQTRRPSTRKVVVLAGTLLLLLVAGFVAGFLPRSRVRAQVTTESRQHLAKLPVVNVAPVRRTASESEVRLPASIQAITEAPILARTDGYLKRRYVDIGDRVEAGQVLAEIDAPEIDQQVAQAAAAVEHARATIEQAKAASEQARANERLARVTAERWAGLLLKGAVSQQEHDVYQAQFQAHVANVQGLERARMAAENNFSAMQANLQRLKEMRGYRTVRAPFSGVITMRNVDVGALIGAGQTMLFRVAQDASVRAYVNVPQQYAQDVHPGQMARLEFAEMPGRVFQGRVVRSADALDSTSRTILAEVQVPNGDGALRAGMYGQIRVGLSRKLPPLVIPANSVISGPDGSQAPTVARDGHIVFRKVTLGRDFGREIEVMDGLAEGSSVVVNPGDSVREGMRVEPKLIPQKGS